MESGVGIKDGSFAAAGVTPAHLSRAPAVARSTRTETFTPTTRGGFGSSCLTQRGSRERGVHHPEDVAIAPGGKIYVLDSSLARIQIFRPDAVSVAS
jgi:hypothetical protein